MLSFLVSLRIFYGLLLASILAALVLLFTYQRERKNLLLRFCCLLILAMYAVIVAGHVRHGGQADIKDSFCEAQAIFLNYCYICIHAHACFMMLNNCYIAMGWRFRLFEEHLDRESTFVFLAFTIPLLSLLAILVLVYGHPEAASIHPGAYFCTVTKPRLYTSTIWFMLFSIPGSGLSVFLLYKTWRARQRMLIYGSATQLSRTYLATLSLSTFVYLSLSFGSFVPLLILKTPPDPEPLLLEWLPPPHLRSPWTNPDMCRSGGADNIGVNYYARLLCPAALSYFPAVVGIALFLMYGLGSHARSAYRSLFNSCFFPTAKRRNSAMPLMETVPPLHTKPPPIAEELPEDASSPTTTLPPPPVSPVPLVPPAPPEGMSSS